MVSALSLEILKGSVMKACCFSQVVTAGSSTVLCHQLPSGLCARKQDKLLLKLLLIIKCSASFNSEFSEVVFNRELNDCKSSTYSMPNCLHTLK